jgi:hypothetical protein
MGTGVTGTVGSGTTLTSSIPVLIGGVDASGVARTLAVNSDGSLAVAGSTPSRVPSGSAETLPRWSLQSGALTPAAGVTYVMRITLAPKSYTTVRMFLMNTNTTGNSNMFFGLYNATTLAKLAGSADVASNFNGQAAVGFINSTLNATVTTAGDYYLALLVGTVGTAPTFAGGLNLNSVFLAGDGTTDDLANKHNTGSLTALPDPLVRQTGTPSSFLYFWARYS